MKTSWQILTLLLALALVVLSAQALFEKQTNETTESISDSEVVYESIMSRSSVRNYTSEKVSEELIEKLLRAGMAAPTAGNKHPWEFVVVSDRALLDHFPNIIKGAHMASKAQLAIVVLGTPSRALMPEYWIQDCSAATENILLAAHGLGLGAVWCGAYPENGTGRVAAMSKLLNLPVGTFALNIIVIGHPEGEAIVKDKWDEQKVHHNTY